MTHPSRPYHILGIGNAIVDIISSVSEEALADHHMAKGAMTLIDETRADALYAALPAARESSGGSSANSAAIVASLGGTAAFTGKVADDQLGRIFAHDIQAAGVAFHTPPLKQGAGTARCLIMVTPDAERTMGTYLGACAALTAQDIDAELIAQSSIVLLEGYLFDKPSGQQAFYEAARIARDNGTKVALTLSDANCVRRHHEAFTDFVIKHVDILFANEKEIKAFCATESFDAAACMVKGMCDVAVLTRGGDGALIVTPASDIAVAPAKIEKLVDTTGAGDAFAGGFLYGFSQNMPLQDCGRLAAFAAGQIISQVGARALTPLKDILNEGKTAVKPAPLPKTPRP